MLEFTPLLLDAKIQLLQEAKNFKVGLNDSSSINQVEWTQTQESNKNICQMPLDTVNEYHQTTNLNLIMRLLWYFTGTLRIQLWALIWFSGRTRSASSPSAYFHGLRQRDWRKCASWLLVYRYTPVCMAPNARWMRNLIGIQKNNMTKTMICSLLWHNELAHFFS